MKTLTKTYSIHPSPLRLGLPRVHRIWIIRGFLLVPLVLAWFALAPTARAVSPAPDGGYANANTAEGTNALFSLTTGLANTAIGYQALYHNTTGTNTAIGYQALLTNTTGTGNTAAGYQALMLNSQGTSNTANGSKALLNNTTGTNNTASGRMALSSNKIGSHNAAFGDSALLSNTANDNTALGYQALYHNTTATTNTAIGFDALYANSVGGKNTATGYYALKNNTGSNNIGFGYNAGDNLTTGSGNIDIGSAGAAGESNTIRIGTVGTQTRAFVAGISVAAVAGAPVVVNSPSGQLGVAASSARFKQNIQAMGEASDQLLALKPVTFRYRPEIDPEGIPQFGLVAEDVEKINPALVTRDAKGHVYTVRYEAVNAMLLNEFLKEHRKNEEQEATIAELKSTVAKQQKDSQATAARQQKQIEALTAGLQKVSAQVEMSRRAPEMASSTR